MTSRLSNPLALAVLALTFERPMHPYEMAATLKHRQKHESIKLRYGSLYTVIEQLTERGFIRPKETTRDGKRPERTVYALTPAGHDELRDWMRDLVAQPAREFPQFQAALALLPTLAPEEAVALLRDRARLLAGVVALIQTILTQVAAQDLSSMISPGQTLPAHLMGLKFPAIFVVDAEYQLVMVKAELAFVNELVRRVTDDEWGPVEIWRNFQATCERNYQSDNDPAQKS